jgi:tRNA(fMet)-specific endonuclease VapC
LRYLLDTNVISEPLRPAPEPRILEKLRQHQSELATAAVVWHELVFGFARLPPSRKRDAVGAYLLETVFETIRILPYDRAAADWHARERARLTDIGRPVPFADGQIAAIARENGLVLVTSNLRDFEPFEGLTVEDWRAAP